MPKWPKKSRKFEIGRSLTVDKTARHALVAFSHAAYFLDLHEVNEPLELV